MFAPGDTLVTSAVGGLNIGILICYDVEFPETVRALALAGAGLVAVPTALVRPFDSVARTLVPARALENQVYVAYAGLCGAGGRYRVLRPVLRRSVRTGASSAGPGAAPGCSRRDRHRGPWRRRVD